MAIYQGAAFVSVTNATGTRYWAIAPGSSTFTGASTPQDKTDRVDVEAATSHTFTVMGGTSGLTPPPANTDYNVAIYDANGAQVYHSGTVTGTLSSGTNVTVHITSDGTSSGTPLVGCFRIYLRMMKLGGIDAYDVNSDSVNTRGLVRVSPTTFGVTTAATDWNDGAVSGTRGYPDREQVTVTMSHGPKSTNTARAFNCVVKKSDLSATYKTTKSTVSSTGTTQTLASGDRFRVDTDYPLAATTVLVEGYVKVSDYLPDSDSSFKWIKLPASLSDGTRVSDDTFRSATFTVDPRITVSAPTNLDSGTTRLYNRGETANVQITVTNARGVGFDPEGTHTVQSINSSNSAVEETATIVSHNTTSGVYDLDILFGQSNVAALDTTGTSKKLRWRDSDSLAEDPADTTQYGLLSSKLLISTVSNPASIDNGVNCTSHASRLPNRGEQVTVTYYIFYARAASYSPASITSKLKTSDSTTEDSQSIGHASSLYTHTYTTLSNDPASNAGKAWKVSVVDTVGNTTGDATTGDTNTAFSLSDLLLVTPTSTYSIYNRGESASINLALKYADNRNYTSKSSITVTVYDDNGSTVESTVSNETSDGSGICAYIHAIDATDAATWDNVGRAKKVLVTHSGNTTNQQTLTFTVSRKYYVSKTDLGATVDPTTIVNAIKVGKTAGADDVTVRNRSQTAYFSAYVYNIRGERLTTPTLNYNVRPVGSEVFEDTNASDTLAAGLFEGSYAVDSDEATGGKALVIATGTIGNQPRTGTAGSGNFAETDTTTAEWTVSSTLTVESRTQKEGTRNADAEDTIFSIAVHLLYGYGHVADASGDSITGASCTVELIDPDGITLTTKNGTTNGDGWTTAQSFTVQPPESDNWSVKVSASWNGNTGEDTQVIKFTSPFAGNKAVIADLGPVVGIPNVDANVPTAVEGDIAIPGDVVIVGFGLAVRDPVSGTTARVNLTEATPRYALISYDQDAAGGYLAPGAQVLQSDNETWLKNTDPGYTFHFREFKNQVDNNMAWTALHGAAAQGVTTSNGYPTASGTAGWPKRRLYLLVEFTYNGADFVQGTKNEFGHRDANERRKLIVAGVGNPTRPGTHWSPGDAIYAESGLGIANNTTFVAQPFGSAGISFLSEDANGQTLYLDASLNWVQGSTAHVHTMSESPADSNKALFQLTSGQTASWPVRGVQVVFRMKDSDGRTYVVQIPLDVKDSKFKHDAAAPESDITFDTVTGHHHVGTDSRAIGDRS